MAFKRWALSALLLVAVVLATAATAQAGQVYTGRSCVSEWYYDAQSIQRLGYRCAQGRVNFWDTGGVRWHIVDYDMLYTVSAGMSYGPHNNENPAWIASGYSSGMRSGLSADSGPTGYWFKRTFWGDSWTYKGPTRFAMNAYPDIPNVSDPRLYIETSIF